MTVLLRALIFVVVAVATAGVARADAFGAWAVTFKDGDKEATMRCGFSPARLWISEQSAVVRFDSQREPWLAKVVIDLKNLPIDELSFTLQSGDLIIMEGSFDAGSTRGTWRSPTLSCEGTWVAHRTVSMPAPRLVEMNLKTTSGDCPEDMPPARVWFQAQQPLSVEDATERPQSYRRVELLFLSTHTGEYLLETTTGEFLRVSWSGGSLPEISAWTSLSRECKGIWTMTRIPQ